MGGDWFDRYILAFDKQESFKPSTSLKQAIADDWLDFFK